MTRIETLAVHAGGEPDRETGAVAAPIHLSTTFAHGPAGERVAGFEYQREHNPTQQRLETALAALEGGAAALAFGSGMAAMNGLLEALPSGSHFLYPRDCYTGLRSLADEFLPERDIRGTAVDMADLAAVQAALRPETRLLWAETPSNPLLEVADIGALAALAHAHGALLACDNTFATPVLQRPLALGAGILAPFSAWLILRGCRSLPARMAWHCRGAHALAGFLGQSSVVAAVNYPGLASHPGHGIAARQMSDFGGMLSFRLKGGRDAALHVAGALRLALNATSLGGPETLVEHRASVEGASPRSPQDLLRVSVGLEHPDDLLADFGQALARA
jgi:cystathionine gamma-synthase